MSILIVGSHGKIGRLLTRKLAEAGNPPRCLVRQASQEEEMRELGGQPVVGDLEGEYQHAFDGIDTVVFTAGSGGHTGGDKTLLIDLWGARKTIDACLAKGIRRYLMVSALRAGDPDNGPARIRHYLVAKKLADEYLQGSGLDYTIVRPGGLLDEPGTGLIKVTTKPEPSLGSIPREDVAEVIIACLELPSTVGKTFDLVSGETPIREALASLA